MPLNDLLKKCSRHVLALMLALASPLVSAAELPDLMIWGPSLQPRVVWETYSASSCSVIEGCVTTGTRRLLRFSTEARNVGTTDLTLGSPAGNPLFVYASCHNHYHFNDYMDYKLRNTTGTVVAGLKQGFCLLDVLRWDPTSTGTFSKYHCSNQGIQAGWADVYDSDLPCQYVDVTDIPAGEYVLELHVNPLQLIPEASFSNNLTTVSITIPASITMTNNACASAQPLVIGTMVGDTSLLTPDGTTNCGSSNSTRDAWYKYTPKVNGTATFTTCGSDFDTVLSVHSACAGTSVNTLACNDDAIGTGCGDALDPSVITMSVTANTMYLIRVSGFLGDFGMFQLTTIGPPVAGPAKIDGWPSY
jgi:hypothetical protein